MNRITRREAMVLGAAALLSAGCGANGANGAEATRTGSTLIAALAGHTHRNSIAPRGHYWLSTRPR